MTAAAPNDLITVLTTRLSNYQLSLCFETPKKTLSTLGFLWFFHMARRIKSRLWPLTVSCLGSLTWEISAPDFSPTFDPTNPTNTEKKKPPFFSKYLRHHRSQFRDKHHSSTTCSRAATNRMCCVCSQGALDKIPGAIRCHQPSGAMRCRGAAVTFVKSQNCHSCELKGVPFPYLLNEINGGFVDGIGMALVFVAFANQTFFQKVPPNSSNATCTVLGSKIQFIFLVLSLLFLLPFL